MACKKRRILKGDWAEFCRSFTSANIMRRATVFQGNDAIIGEPGLPFLSLSYDPEVSTIAVVLGDNAPDRLAREVAAVKKPRAVYFIEEEGAEGSTRGVQIQPGPGQGMIRLLFDDEAPDAVRNQWTADIAYSIYLARGGVHGEDQGDWFQAEALIADTIARFLS